MCLEGLLAGVTAMTARFPARTGELVEQLARVIEEVTQQPSPKTPAQQCMHTLQQRVSDYLDSDECRHGAVLVAVIKTLVQAGVLPEADQAAVFGWIDRQCRQQEGVTDGPLVRALFDFLFFMAWRVRQEMGTSIIVARDVSLVLGELATDTQQDRGDQYRIIESGKALESQIVPTLMTAVERLLGEVEWAVNTAAQVGTGANRSVGSDEFAAIMSPTSARITQIIELCTVVCNSSFDQYASADVLLRVVKERMKE